MRWFLESCEVDSIQSLQPRSVATSVKAIKRGSSQQARANWLCELQRNLT